MKELKQFATNPELNYVGYLQLNNLNSEIYLFKVAKRYEKVL